MLEDGDRGVIRQRDEERYAVAPHIPCGVVTPELLRKLADVSEAHGVQALKITSSERIVLIGITEEQVDAVWADLGMQPGAAVGLCVRSVRVCPGTTYCRYGNQDSLGLGLKLDAKYHGVELPGKLKMALSGCGNQCAESAVRDIGLVGAPKGWKMLLGGCVGAKPRLGELYAKGLSDDDALDLIERVLETYRRICVKKKRLGRMIDEVGGLEAFRAEVDKT